MGLKTEGYPMSGPKNFTPPPILSGWKAIANHLGKGVRTVQRYEIELGLPVRRLVGKAGASVVATTAELDAWVSASPLRRSFALRQALPDELPLFRTVLAEHHRLREQMARFRAEMHTAVELLRENLFAIQACNIDESTQRYGVLMPFKNGILLN